MQLVSVSKDESPEVHVWILSFPHLIIIKRIKIVVYDSIFKHF